MGLHIKNHEVTSELLIFRGTSSSEHSIHDMTTLCSDYRTMYVFRVRQSRIMQSQKCAMTDLVRGCRGGTYN